MCFAFVAKFSQTPYSKLNHHSLSLILYFSVMVSIWEGNQCKKAQLTLMEISTAIKNKVVSPSRCGGRFSFLSFPLKQKCLWALRVNRNWSHEAAKFVLLSFFTLIETICRKFRDKTTAQECKTTTSGWRALLKNVLLLSSNSCVLLYSRIPTKATPATRSLLLWSLCCWHLYRYSFGFTIQL